MFRSLRIKWICGGKSDLAKLGFEPDEARKLCANGIKYRDDLWARIGKDFDKGIDELADKTDIPKDVIIRHLAAKAASEAKVGKVPRVLGLWLDALLFLVVLLLVVILLRA